MQSPQPNVVSRTRVDINEGLRHFMLQVYNYMTLGLGISGLVGYGLTQSPDLMMSLASGPGFWIVILAQLGMVLWLSMGINRMSPATAALSFLTYAALMGVTIGVLLMAFTGESVMRVFFITAGTFSAMSLYGYTTKRDLSGMGSFLFMGLIGLIIASVVNMFMNSSGLHFVISLLGVAIFTGLTAWDTQKIKSMYTSTDEAGNASKKSILGALTLYLDFINLFIFLLRLIGDRR